METGFKALTPQNLGCEHICCAISEKKGESCVADKKRWLAGRMEEGLVFLKLDVRGKVFIEYLPAEMAWAPVEAEGYMYIDCFWVSGKYKGQGYADQLLDRCIADAKEKGKVGLAALSSEKKRPFLSDGGYLRHRGFRLADTAAPFFQLLYLPFDETAPPPRLFERAKSGVIDQPGLVLYYTDQCPHAGKYAAVLKAAAERHGAACQLIKIQDRQTARSVPCPATTYALFKDGRFVTNEILSEKKMESMGLW